MRVAPGGTSISVRGPRLVGLLEKIGKRGLVGGSLSPGVSCDFQKPTPFSVLSLEFSAVALAPDLPAATFLILAGVESNPPKL